jgi:uncharacterized protein DUF5677
MTYEVTNEDPEIGDRAFGRIETYLSSPWDGRDVPTLDLGHNLLISIVREYQHLRLGYEKDTALEAWACRNLLELDIYVKYVLISGANAKRFIGDVTIDGIELFESMKEWMRTLAPTIETLALDETLRLAYERKASEGVIESKHLEIRDLAEAVGMTVDYRHTNRLCSKLVHPTAWSVLSMNEDGEYAAFRPLLFNAGVRYGVDGFNTIRGYAEKLGGG